MYLEKRSWNNSLDNIQWAKNMWQQRWRAYQENFEWDNSDFDKVIKRKKMLLILSFFFGHTS